MVEHQDRGLNVARVIVGSYMVRYPLGGMMSWVLQYLAGFRQLGHDVYFVEKAGYPDACYNPIRRVSSDDCGYGTRALKSLLRRIGLEECWCFVDAHERYHGMDRAKVEEVFATADIFIDMGTHGTWLEEASRSGLRILIDGEPAFTQMKMSSPPDGGQSLPEYDVYVTTGHNIGTSRSTAPDAGRHWEHIFHPVEIGLFEVRAPPVGAAFTTVMNWKSYDSLEFRGVVYGHKDVEFPKFEDLPRMTDQGLEIAVFGKDVPKDALKRRGWRVRPAHAVTISFDAFTDYIGSSKGEFGVCKNGFVATNNGWFSDRSAAYLASGRPVVLQDTGFSAHLPTGQGLFAVTSVEDAATAIERISAEYERHAEWARELAVEYLSAAKVLQQLLEKIGV